ncbi:MAG: glycosyl transferase [Bacteroidetes bacterium]|nr:MAG: glycosyl transferase [Bacteroidota bacterium]
MILFCICLVLLACYSILIGYYYQSWKQVPEFIIHDHKDFVPFEKLSVIIPARNEEKNIRACLESVTNQTYPAELFEIIVVDDHSDDTTASIVNEFTSHGVKLISLKDEIIQDPTIVAYKKKAIETGIKFASGVLIVTTDADCIVPNDWLLSIAHFHFLRKPVFIAAPVKIPPQKTLSSYFQSMDFAVLQGITAASVYKGFHSMCNGANLAYEKSVFNEVGGFDGIDHIASGDDMLLMHKIAAKYPGRLAYLKADTAIVETEPAESWRAFVRQRIRWASKADKYNDGRIIAVLAMVYLLNFLMLVMVVGAIWVPHWILFFGILLFYKTVAEWWFAKSVFNYFGLEKTLFWFPFLQPLHLCYVVVSGFFGKMGSYEWKGRMVK